MERVKVTDKLQDLMFTVRKEPLQTITGIKTDRFGIVRNDNNAVLGVVSEDYSIVQNADLVEQVLPELNKIGKFDIKRCMIENNGAKVYMECRFMEMGIEMPKGVHSLNEEKDLVFPMLTLSNSYDSTKKVGFMAGIFRLICANGAIAGTRMFDFSKKHMGIEFDGIGQSAANALNMLNTRILPKYKTMVETIYTNGRFEAVCKNILETVIVNSQLGKFDEIKHKDSKSTWTLVNTYNGNEWNAYNNVTKYLTHAYKGSYTQQITHNNGLMSAFEI